VPKVVRFRLLFPAFAFAEKEAEVGGQVKMNIELAFAKASAGTASNFGHLRQDDCSQDD